MKLAFYGADKLTRMWQDLHTRLKYLLTIGTDRRSLNEYANNIIAV